MQTFLPHPDFVASAAVLDDRRLGKQRVETYQILRALTWPKYGWKNHPAVRMWRGFTPALVRYGLDVCDAWEARGRADATRSALLAFTGGRVPETAALRAGGQLPPWLGEEPVHVSHRSALLRKDPAHYEDRFGDVPTDLPYVWPGRASDDQR
ncbi:MAG TPA: MSMEG_6728 family protein [Mycobacteriales bacterium]|nr:MSMEG_6728 family protein [Mycobacteriales bacterium]